VTKRIPITYRDAGVDIDAKSRLMERIKPHLRATFTKGVVSDIGLFGSLFSMPHEYHDPLLVASADSVGTKVMVATMAGKHDTVGRDIVAHCVNDLLVQGARSLFFMDYIAAGHLDTEVLEAVLRGLADGCREAECALIGGEIAEMPGIYAEGQYDLVGFIVGAVERTQVVTGEKVRPGDALVGLASDGLHTNGYSLARKLIFEVAGWPVDRNMPELGCTVADELLRVHRNYAGAVLPLLAQFAVHGMAHITGGGLPDNVIRSLPQGCRALIRRDAWDVSPIFSLLQSLGNVPEEDLYHTFNMGIGFVLIVPADQAEHVIAHLRDAGERPCVIGQVITGERGVELV